MTPASESKFSTDTRRHMQNHTDTDTNKWAADTPASQTLCDHTASLFQNPPNKIYIEQQTNTTDTGTQKHREAHRHTQKHTIVKIQKYNNKNTKILNIKKSLFAFVMKCSQLSCSSIQLIPMCARSQQADAFHFGLITNSFMVVMFIITIMVIIIRKKALVMMMCAPSRLMHSILV